MSTHGRGTEVRPAAVRKDLRPLLRAANEQGWVVTRLTNNHLRWASPEGRVVHSSKNLNTPHVLHIIRRDLMRAGLKLNGNGSPPPKEVVPMPEIDDKGASTSLGDKLREAQAAAAASANGSDAEPRALPGETKKLVRQCFEREPGRIFKSDDIVQTVTKASGVTPSTVYLALKHLWLEGVLHKLDRAQWQLKAPLIPKPAAPLVAGERVGDESLDQELRELDEALAALAKIESMVRKHRRVVQQLAELKKVLGGVSLT